MRMSRKKTLFFCSGFIWCMVASEVVNDSVAARGPDGVVAMEGDCESLPV